VLEIINLAISNSAAAELSRLAAFGGSPGNMYIDLVNDLDNEGWLHIKLTAGTSNGSPIARTQGVTLFADPKKFKLFKGLSLDYYSDLSGGGFLISTPKNTLRCSCGSGFKLLEKNDFF
tara:strand:+ start:316 stop:672 length:357 start_codon:yes stop_codon:yes gene_type:complete